MTRKKKVLLCTDFSLSYTGFGRFAKCLLKYLYKTGKYDLVHYCCGTNWSNPSLSKTPWKSIGAMPDAQQELDGHLSSFPPEQKEARLRVVAYGDYNLNRIIEQEKPDVAIFANDIWGVDFATSKYWWNKITSVIWTTLDSLPLLPSSVDLAPKIKNYWIWSSFATNEMHRLGHKHVKTVHGPVEDSSFFKLPKLQKQQLRQKHSIPPDAFITGFVFRNQLRKSVPNLLEGYSLFKSKHPELKNPRLLLHTSFSEGWNIHKLSKEYNIDPNEVLTSYVCRACNDYQVRPFTGEEQKCPYCGAEKAMFTTGINKGVTEEQLNEIYNLMDVVAHPISSGGQEIPVLEAKFAEIITAVTNYSCGEELCEEGSESLPLDWAEYREHGTEFRKASTLPSSIAKQLSKVYSMEDSKRSQLGKEGREWAIKNYSINSIGKQVEDFLDAAEFTSFDFKDIVVLKDPHALVPDIKDDSEWLIKLYKEVLKMNLDATDGGHQHWMARIKDGMPRQQIENFFRNEAAKELQKQKEVKFEDLLNKDDKRRILICLPESIGDLFLSTALFEDLRKRYPRPEWALYFATKKEYFEIFDGNSYIDKLIEFIPQMDNLFWTEGIGEHNGYFNVTYPLHFPTQRLINYTHNEQDIHGLQLKGELFT